MNSGDDLYTETDFNTKPKNNSSKILKSPKKEKNVEEIKQNVKNSKNIKFSLEEKNEIQIEKLTKRLLDTVAILE